ncbi:MAG: hypothetical protein QOI54_374 [Actinomycetota bacterium]|nr:hypothetical protein [Actinomycetota bacterium]
MPLDEVEGDRGRAGLVPAAVEFLAQRDDLLLERPGGALRAVDRTPGPRLQCTLALR